ncbi:neurogenic locus notch homolog protein 1-like, partial [Diaphorina citri]|uniref:Neurogenic locus notch homolog protein 1-like n=1 Tax=Diaphorina citri TaxID=121845 RepID=A0A3Q0JI31_DIACI
GYNAECKVINHTPICTCPQGFIGDAFSGCYPKPPEPEQPVVQEDTCNCAPNADCKDGVCVCLPDYYGDGYVSCRPECVLNSDCPSNKACIRNKCKNPCVPGTCGEGAICDVINHVVMCTCPPGTTGSPFIQCKLIQYEPVYTNPCQPSPCGPNSQCREVNKQAVCSCLPNYFGSPPACRPECTVNSDCPLNKACFNQKCVDPCPGTCGQNANCKVQNHNPICNCKPGYTGDPRVYCNKIPPRPPPQEDVPEPVNPCYPSPCGPYSQCRDIGGSPSCSCLPNYIGAPPNCRPECVQNNDCSNDKACINEKCQDPCPGSCGYNAL